MRDSALIWKLLFALFLIIFLFWDASVTFMNIYHLPISASRPWSIVYYFMEYHNSPIKHLRLNSIICFLFPFFSVFVLIMLALWGKNHRALHGNARFATMSEVKKAGLIDLPKGYEKTILVGKFKGKYLSYGGYQFVMLSAPTRSGKGVGIVIPNCLNFSDSLVVLDIKGENFDITSGFRKACGQEVFLFAPFDTDGQTACYNPLTYISSNPADRIGDIDAIATALYSGGNQNDKFWSENAKDLFRGICLLVLEHPTLPKTLGEILRQASGKGKPIKDHLQEMLNEASEQNRSYSSACTDALNRILNNSDNTLSGIIATFNTPLLILQNPRVDAATSSNSFDLRDVRRKRMTIYFKVTPDKLKDASVLVNIFFDQLLNLNTRTLPKQDPTLKYQCLVLLDEMTSIGKVAMINQAVSYMAGYNMRLLTIIQNKSQLEEVYGKAGAVTILSNHALMVMYAPSPTVQNDAKEYSEMLGYETVKSRSKSLSTNSNSTSISDQRRALMMPQEIRELGQNREIISLENCKPILCEKIRYYEDPNFMARANMPTPEIETINIDRHIAIIENRVREINENDLKRSDLEENLVNQESWANASTQLLDRLCQENLDLEQREEIIEDFVEDITGNVITIITNSSNSNSTSSIPDDNFMNGMFEGTDTEKEENTAISDEEESDENFQTNDESASPVKEKSLEQSQKQSQKESVSTSTKEENNENEVKETLFQIEETMGIALSPSSSNSKQPTKGNDSEVNLMTGKKIRQKLNEIKPF